MRIGVVSDTHNNLRNIDQIIFLFNKEEVDLVIHTGDIANSTSLEKFANLNCDLIGVFGNNDRSEIGLKEVAKKNNFKIQDPPFDHVLGNRKIVIFHEPELISEYLEENLDVDLVVHGHTHRFRYEIVNGAVLFNPGESAGIIKGKNAIGIVNLKDLTTKRIFF